MANDAQLGFLGGAEAATLYHLGFVPSIPVFSAVPQFGQADIQRAVFESRYPALSALRFDVADGESSWPIWMTVELVQLVFVPYTPGSAFRTIGFYAQPDFYLRGVVTTTGLESGDPASLTLHALVKTSGTGDAIDDAYVQAVVVEPTATTAEAESERSFLLADSGFGQLR